MPGREPKEYRPRRAFGGQPSSDPDNTEDDTHPHDAHTHDAHTHDAHTHDAHTHDAHQDDAQMDDAHTDDAQMELARSVQGRDQAEDRDDEGQDDEDREDDADEEERATILPRVGRDRSTTVWPSRDRPRWLSAGTGEIRERGPGLGPRARQLLMVVGVVVVVIAGLLFGYSALRIGRDPVAPRSSAGVTAPSEGGSETPAAPVLDDTAMINAEGAAKIDPKPTWQVASTQRGLDALSPRPACLTGELADGQPNPDQIVLRVISGGGQKAPALLHEAAAYPTPEDAGQAFAVLTRTIGGCSVAGAYVDSGRAVAGLGDQAVGVVLQLMQEDSVQFRTVVVARTGSVVDVVDVARAGKAASAKGVVQALAAALTVQCATSGGGCVGDVSVTNAPPPLGGDEPGFLAAGDLPPVGRNPPAWVGDPVDAPSADFTGSQCETIDWSRVAAKERASRTYLQQDSAQTFGLDEIIITTDSGKAAAALLDKVRGDVTSCDDRKLTATVAKPKKVSGEGAEDAAIEGWTTVVRQKSTTGTATYRVGMVSVGNKAIYLFLNPVKNLDFTTGQFNQVAVRAGQRASQVS